MATRGLMTSLKRRWRHDRESICLESAIRRAQWPAAIAASGPICEVQKGADHAHAQWKAYRNEAYRFRSFDSRPEIDRQNAKLASFSLLTVSCRLPA